MNTSNDFPPPETTSVDTTPPAAIRAEEIYERHNDLFALGSSALSEMDVTQFKDFFVTTHNNNLPALNHLLDELHRVEVLKQMPTDLNTYASKLSRLQGRLLDEFFNESNDPGTIAKLVADAVNDGRYPLYVEGETYRGSGQKADFLRLKEGAEMPAEMVSVHIDDKLDFRFVRFRTKEGSKYGDVYEPPAEYADLFEEPIRVNLPQIEMSKAHGDLVEFVQAAEPYILDQTA